MSLILHAGTHKTGTSTLQRAFDEHRQELLEMGVHYPDVRRSFDSDAAGHHAFVHAVAHEPHRPEVDAMTDDMADALATGHTVLLSAEPVYRHAIAGVPGDWWSRHLRYLERLASILPTDQIQIVLVFRRRDRFVESAYQERVANGFGKPFEDYAMGADRLLDYERQLAQFRRAFPVVTTGSYEQLAKAGLVGGFLDLIGVAPLGVAPLGGEPPKWERRATDARLTLWMAAAYRADPDPELVTQRRRFSKNPISTQLFPDDYGSVTLWTNRQARRRVLEQYGDHEPVEDERAPAVLTPRIERAIDDLFAEYLAAKGMVPPTRRTPRVGPS